MSAMMQKSINLIHSVCACAGVWGSIHDDIREPCAHDIHVQIADMEYIIVVPLASCHKSRCERQSRAILTIETLLGIHGAR